MISLLFSSCELVRAPHSKEHVQSGSTVLIQERKLLLCIVTTQCLHSVREKIGDDTSENDGIMPTEVIDRLTLCPCMIALSFEHATPSKGCGVATVLSLSFEGRVRQSESLTCNNRRK